MALPSIRYNDLEKLQVDERHRLYWGGVLIEMRKALSLPGWVNVAAVMTGIGTVGMSGVMLAQELGWRATM